MDKIMPDISKTIPFNLEQVLPIEIKVNITDKQNKPAIELRRLSTDPEFIKAIVKAAYHDQPIIILPVFTNKIISLGSLVEKGILYINPEDKLYHFTF